MEIHWSALDSNKLNHLWCGNLWFSSDAVQLMWSLNSMKPVSIGMNFVSSGPTDKHRSKMFNLMYWATHTQSTQMTEFKSINLIRSHWIHRICIGKYEQSSKLCKLWVWFWCCSIGVRRRGWFSRLSLRPCMKFSQSFS